MIGIIITVRNRAEYLFHCLESLKAADLTNCKIVIVDDASTDIRVWEMAFDFAEQVPNSKLINTNINVGVKVAIRKGIDAVLHECDYFIILDGDTMVRKDFVSKIMALPKNGIATGFNSFTKNKNGEVRHPAISETEAYYVKKTIGGANVGFTKQVYFDFVESALMAYGHWDYQLCNSITMSGGKIYSVKESVVQHIGVVSSMDHTTEEERHDSAEDFYLHDLKDVTLISIGFDYDKAKTSIDKCLEYVRFGDVKILTDKEGEYAVRIKKFANKAHYNTFMLKHLSDYIDTKHFLIVNEKSHIINPSAWRYDWLEYDYIGAPWDFYTDGYNVGDGGFSLRSHHLAKVLSLDNKIKPMNDHLTVHMDDDRNICRIHRAYLEDKHAIQYAPLSVARKFSMSIPVLKNQTFPYTGTFGVHDLGNIDYSKTLKQY